MLGFIASKSPRQIAMPASEIIKPLKFGVVDTSVRMLPIKKRVQTKRKRLLIIRLDAIGDFILFLDTFKEYHRLYPSEEWEITLLGNQIWRVLAENLRHADQYWFMEVKRFRRDAIYRYRWLRRVRDANFDLVIQPTFSRVYWVGDAIVRASGAPKRIGSEGDFAKMTRRQKRRSYRWYTDLIPVAPEPLMELDQNAKFINGLGLTGFEASLPRLLIPDEVQQSVDTMLEGVGLPKSSGSNLTDFYIFFPGAGEKYRQWPVEHFVDVARRIHDYKGWFGVICGGPGKEGLAEQLLAYTDKIPLLNLSGKANLIELAGLIYRSQILIGNETSAIHIASAVGTPSICILGGGHFRRFVPYSIPNTIHAVYKEMDCYGCNWKCQYDKTYCILNIEVETVWRAFKELC